MESVGTSSVDLHLLEERLVKHNSEIAEMQSAVQRYDRRTADLNPAVVEYNELLRDKKDLRRAIAAMQKQFKIMQEFLQGTSLFDTRFPLFSQPAAKEEKSEAAH
jgi:hypothetical protein